MGRERLEGGCYAMLLCEPLFEHGDTCSQTSDNYCSDKVRERERLLVGQNDLFFLSRLNRRDS